MPQRPPQHVAKAPSGTAHETKRPSAAACGYDWRWRKARLLFLRDNPLCVVCGEAGRLEDAWVVDHIRPHNGNPILFWDRSNWQALCKRCHDRKTATERKPLT